MAAFGLGGFGDMRGGPGGIAGLGLGAPRGFEEQYHCYPVSFQVSSYVLVLFRYLSYFVQTEVNTCTE